MDKKYNKEELDINKKESNSSILNTNKNDDNINNNDNGNKNGYTKNNPTTNPFIPNSVLELELLFCRNVPSDFIKLIKNIVELLMRFSRCDYDMEAELFCLNLSEKLIQIIEKLFKGNKYESMGCVCMYVHIQYEICKCTNKCMYIMHIFTYI